MLLSAIIFLPLFFALLLLVSPREAWIRPAALVFSLVEFFLSLEILGRFDNSTPALQMVERLPWIP